MRPRRAAQLNQKGIMSPKMRFATKLLSDKTHGQMAAARLVRAALSSASQPTQPQLREKIIFGSPDDHLRKNSGKYAPTHAHS